MDASKPETGKVPARPRGPERLLRRVNDLPVRDGSPRRCEVARKKILIHLK